MNQVITASRLSDGAVVFFGPEKRWVDLLAEAAVFTSVDATAEAMKAAQKDEAENHVLDIYAIDVAERRGVLVPIKLREAIRAQGPTVHPQHGKAAAAARNG